MKQRREELAQQVRYLRDVQGLSMRQIGIELGLSRGKCSRLYGGGAEARRAQSCLEPHRALIAAWFREHPSLLAVQVHERLRQRDVRVGYTAVKRFTRQYRRPPARFYHALEFGPGEEAQVDWFFVNHPVLGKLSGFAWVLSYSRYFFARFYPRASFEFFIAGHLEAFAAVGLPRALRYDNLKSVVISRRPLHYNAGYLEFARHHGIEIRLCNPTRANEKGRVERAIRTVRETFCNVADRYGSLAELNGALDDWCRAKNSTPHRSTGKVPAVLRLEEPLQPLPALPWRNVQVHPPQRCSKTGLVTFDTNRYSVPDYLAGERLSVHAGCEQIEIYDERGKRVAAHRRSFARNESVVNPAHRSFERISSAAKRERIHAVIQRLDPAVSRFLAANEEAGEDRYATAYLIFTLLRSHAREAVISAVREALRSGSPRASVLQSLFHTTDDDGVEISPRQKHLLTLDYKPRSLEEYEQPRHRTKKPA